MLSSLAESSCHVGDELQKHRKQKTAKRSKTKYSQQLLAKMENTNGKNTNRFLFQVIVLHNPPPAHPREAPTPSSSWRREASSRSAGPFSAQQHG